MIAEPAILAGNTDSRSSRIAVDRPLFLADWQNVVFIHFAIDPALLQPHVPFPLDQQEGTAWISLVAFTQENFRPAFGGFIGRMLTRPVARHGFLNVRTYVRVEEEPGIYFLAEFISNRFAEFVAPRLYGLPYRLAQVGYDGDIETGGRSGEIHHKNHSIRFNATADRNVELKEPAGLSEFLMERYTAWTWRYGIARRFRIQHEPWPQKPAELAVQDLSLLHQTAPWMNHARIGVANYSPGVSEVRIGWPQRVKVKTTGHFPRPSTCGLGLAALLLPTGVLIFGRGLPAWGFMWALAWALFFAAKWFTLCDALAAGARAASGRRLAYLFAWVGMDARVFLEGRVSVGPRLREWLQPGCHLLIGIVMVWGLARTVPGNTPLLAGWVGMLGLVQILHFGLFQLLSAVWRSLGVDARPLMNAPTRAASLSEFWGRRWNRDFHHLAETIFFHPLRKRIGIRGAILATFTVSGIIHDMVISLPARAGFGLPTAYFLIQALGIAIQRSQNGRRLLRDSVLRSRAFTLAFTITPMLLLFHPWFVIRVMVPFLKVIGAF